MEDWILGGVLLTSLLTIKETNVGVKRTEMGKNWQPTYHVSIAPTSLLLSGGASRFKHNLPPPHERMPINQGPVQFSGPLANKICARLVLSLGNRNKELLHISRLCRELKLLANAEEAINTSFCPLEEKSHTFVLRGLRDISEAP